MENPHSILKKVFGYDSFRPGQEEIVSRLLAVQDVLAVMPTGAGKSICIPRQMPKQGIRFSRAYWAAWIIPSMPRSPKPPGTMMPSTSAKASLQAA